MLSPMHKLIKRKSPALQSLLMVLILQLGLSSLLCAISPYQAGASPLTLCTSFGAKTVLVDENGTPVEQDQQQGGQHELGKSCIHCATGGCNGAPLNQTPSAFYEGPKETRFSAQYEAALVSNNHPRPPTRAPPAV